MMGNGFKKAWKKLEKMGFGAVVKPNFKKFRDSAGAGSNPARSWVLVEMCLKVCDRPSHFSLLLFLLKTMNLHENCG